MGYFEPSSFKAGYFTALCFRFLIRKIGIQMMPLCNPGLLPEDLGRAKNMVREKKQETEGGAFAHRGILPIHAIDPESCWQPRSLGSWQKADS